MSWMSVGCGGISAVAAPAGGVFGEIGEDHVGAGAADAEQRFQDDVSLIQPAARRRRLLIMRYSPLT